jgi:hypothetical protein
VVRQGRLIALVGTFLIGCAFLLLGVSCAGTSSEAPKEGQGHTEATNKEQGRSPEATEAEEEARCDRTRTYGYQTEDPTIVVRFTTNDLPGCPKGGLLLGTDKRDFLGGRDGEDRVRGLGGSDAIEGGPDSDILYGGPDGDEFSEGKGDDVIYGGDGNDVLNLPVDGQRDKLYCGKGQDLYLAAKPDKLDYVDSSCENKGRPGGGQA